MLDSRDPGPGRPGRLERSLSGGVSFTEVEPVASDCPVTTVGELAALVPGALLTGDRTAPVGDATHESTAVHEGSVFFCVRGSRVDGHEFASAAARSGAACLVVERALDVACAQILVPSVRRAMGPISAAVHGRPSDRMRVAGVTGTNGKTTTTYLLESIFRAAGLVPAVIGTTGVRVAGEAVPFPRTTPEAPDLQRLLAGMLHRGVEAVAMEVSSHGLDQHRVDGTRFACAVFTNLSQDHLDYHGTMEAYFQAKARLFTPELAERATVNGDVPEGRRIARRTEVPVRTFGLDEGADVRAEDASVTPEGVTFRVGDLNVRSPLRGWFSVYNCLGAVAAARELGIDDGAIREGIAALEGVPGRIQPIDEGQPFTVLVDYAHTPDSLDNVLRAARRLTDRRLIVVFGCGGDRDRGKRPMMGEVATRLSDLTLVTSDNPRSEDPLSIIAQIQVGARAGGGRFQVEPDRRLAIRAALAAAGPGDMVVIAGKGHETGQQFADRTVPFDDREVAREELRRRIGRAG